MKNDTKKEYEYKLKRLEEEEIKLDTSIEEIVEGIRKLVKSESTVKVYLSAILWKEEKEAKRQKIREIIKKINEKIKEELKKNKMTERQKKEYIKWEKIDELHKEMGKNINKKIDHRNYVTLSLYVLIPPRRMRDYSRMYIKENTENLEEGKNYYIYGSGKFILKEYKLSNKKGEKIFCIPSSLEEILVKYIKKYKKMGEKLLDVSDRGLIYRLKNILGTNLGKGVSVDILRHSYIIHQYKNTEFTIKDREELAEKMGHSKAMQEQYYKKE